MLDNLSGATRIYAIVGDPIAQVKSPYGVTRAFEEHGADALCYPVHVKAEDFPLFVESARRTQNMDGVMITVPHKFAAFAACDATSERAAFLRSVNTIIRRPDGSLYGDMFDGLGFVAACEANGCAFAGKRALLVGAGGAGTAIAHAVASAGVSELGVAETDRARQGDLVSRLRDAGFNVSAAPADATGFDIVLNATPMGMRETDPLPVPAETLTGAMFVGDVVTKPEVPPLIAAARAKGCKTSNGVAMFAKVRDLMVAFLLSGKR